MSAIKPRSRPIQIKVLKSRVHPLMIGSISAKLNKTSFGGVFYVVRLLFGLFCGCRGVCHRTESDLFLFLLHSIVLSLLYLECYTGLASYLS